jgi:hypothetical protein
MDFFKVYNIVQSASVNNGISNNGTPLQQIILKSKQSAKKKIQHFRLLNLLKEKNEPIVEKYINNPFIDHDNSLCGEYTTFIKWNFHTRQIGEYNYYYLNAMVKSDMNTFDMNTFDMNTSDMNTSDFDDSKLSKIYLTIVRKNNSSLYVFLEYPNTSYYIVSIILDKYLKNYWEIENF